MVKAVNIHGYYRPIMNDRHLKYNKFFTDGETNLTDSEDYTSHKTVRFILWGSNIGETYLIRDSVYA